ncbi:MAG TPA: S41 family peptidase [Patescibacteria group bacterium]|nr:S41 family peptidase [Patescibacteria group bacterium]
MKKTGKKNIIKKIILFVVVLAVLIGLFFGGYVAGKVTSGKLNLRFNPDMYKQTELPEIFESNLIEQIWTILQTDYVHGDKIKQKELFYGAMKGFVSGVGDPYTVFLDPETSKDFEEQMSGEFEGIGAEIAMRDEVVTIVAPLPGTPADKAGLMPEDKIYKVDEKETVGMSLEEVVKLIRGPKGTEVTLLIVRGSEPPQEVVITRGLIEVKSVEWEERPDDIVYVEISSFNEDTVPLFRKMINKVDFSTKTGLIMDLRSNPGGLLQAALEIPSYWVEKNQVVLVEKFSEDKQTQYTAGNSDYFADIPTVVLIDQGSASGSEIVAGALQDYDKATIVGKKSFGKGSVQSLRKLPDGSSIKVTVAEWLTPNGRGINEQGIQPDVEIDYTRENYENDKDPQLEKAIEILLTK